jgi:hypothetical protein
MILLAFYFQGNAQSIDERLIPNKQVIKNAKTTVKNSLVQLKDSLDLSKSGMRLRKFKLTPCNDKSELSSKYGKMITEFVGSRESCYFYEHRTNYNGSYHSVNFILDLDGELIEKQVDFILVVH